MRNRALVLFSLSAASDSKAVRVILFDEQINHTRQRPSANLSASGRDAVRHDSGVRPRMIVDAADADQATSFPGDPFHSVSILAGNLVSSRTGTGEESNRQPFGRSAGSTSTRGPIRDRDARRNRTSLASTGSAMSGAPGEDRISRAARIRTRPGPSHTALRHGDVASRCRQAASEMKSLPGNGARRIPDL